MSYRLTYTVDADGTTRLEMECDATVVQPSGERAFLAALDRLPKVGEVGEPIRLYNERVPGSRFVTCETEGHLGVHPVGNCLNPKRWVTVPTPRPAFGAE